MGMRENTGTKDKGKESMHMKKTLTRLIWPILQRFETDEEPANYKESHRLILKIVGSLFLILSLGSAVVGYLSAEPAALIPALVFFCVSVVTIVLGMLGSNAAIAKIWGSK